METEHKTSLTKNAYKNPSPTKTNAKQAQGKGFGGIKSDMDSAKSSHGPKEKMSVGVTSGMHNKAVGGHPTHRASEFSGKGEGFHTDCGE